MLLVAITVFCYSISSVSDKQISGKLKCRQEEFAFIISTSTAIWLGLVLLFTGWEIEITLHNMILTFLLAVCKTAEFYTSAILLKTISVYELKAWLGVNISVSYFYNFYVGKADIEIIAVIFCILLLMGIWMILWSDKNRKKTFLLCTAFILSKFLYGILVGMVSSGCSQTTVLFIVMLVVAAAQMPKISLRQVIKKEKISFAFLSRLPNAIGLLTEAAAAVQNIFLYAMIQPIQLLILFIYSLMKKEDMPKMKFWGSVFCIFAVCIITIEIY